MHIDNLHIIVCNSQYIFCTSFILFVIDYAKCPSSGMENSERNSLFSVLHGWKIAFPDRDFRP